MLTSSLLASVSCLLFRTNWCSHLPISQCYNSNGHSRIQNQHEKFPEIFEWVLKYIVDFLFSSIWTYFYSRMKVYSCIVVIASPEGLSWWLRWQKICLWCRGSTPGLGEIPWKREWLVASSIPIILHVHSIQLLKTSLWGLLEIEITSELSPKDRKESLKEMEEEGGEFLVEVSYRKQQLGIFQIVNVSQWRSAGKI